MIHDVLLLIGDYSILKKLNKRTISFSKIGSKIIEVFHI